MRRSARQSGFTLIEVLAALIIVSVGMMGVITAVGQTASNSTYLRDKTIAHWIAMNRLTETRLQPAAPKVDKSSDELEMAGRRWRWTMTVSQTPVETVRRIDVSVRPAEAAETSSLATVTGFYGSAIAPPGSIIVSWLGLQDQGGGENGEDGGDGERDPNEPPGGGEDRIVDPPLPGEPEPGSPDPQD